MIRTIHGGGGGGGGTGGNEVCHCGQFLMGKRRPILGHVGYFGR